MQAEIEKRAGEDSRRIAVIGNGISQVPPPIDEWRYFRINHWYLNGGLCDDWFVGEHPEIVHAVAAYIYEREEIPQIWMPGLSGDAIERNQKTLRCPIRLQKHFARLPALCRWTSDPRPRRPLTGSLAFAVAVGYQPEELFISGIDLYQHPDGEYVTSIKPPDSTDTFAMQYRTNTHCNHSLLADLRYIRNALDAYKGKLTCVGSVMKKYFADDYKRWEWIDG